MATAARARKRPRTWIRTTSGPFPAFLSYPVQDPPWGFRRPALYPIELRAPVGGQELTASASCGQVSRAGIVPTPSHSVAPWRSFGRRWLYRLTRSGVVCPMMAMIFRSGAPAATLRDTAVWRVTWNGRLPTPARTAVALKAWYTESPLKGVLNRSLTKTLQRTPWG